MLPNRITLKALIAGQLVPRQKRTSKCLSTSDFSAADTVQTRDIGTPQETLNECVRHQPIKQMIPENGLEGARTEVKDAFIRSPHRGVKRPKKNYFEHKWRPDGVKVEGPQTRGKYDQSGPNTRSRSRSKILTQVSRRFLRCSICWNPAEIVSGAQSIIKAEELEHKLNSGSKRSAPRVVRARPRKRKLVGARAHVPAKRGALALISPKLSQKTNSLKSNPPETSGIGGKVDDLATNNIQCKVKRERTAKRKVRSLRSTWCEPQVAAADPVQVLKGKQIHLTGFSNIDGHGCLIYSELTDMDTRGQGEVKEKHPHSPTGSQRDDHGENIAVQEENGPTEPSDSEPEVEEFSCQRAKVHLRKLYLSCARTDMLWPFSNRGPKMSSSSEANLAGLGNPSLGNLEAPVSGSNSKTSNVDEIKFKLSNVATDCARGCVQPAPLNGTNAKREDQTDEKVAAEKCFPPENLRSLDRTVNKLDLDSACREPLSVSSKMATISSPMRQPGHNSVTRWGGCESPSSLDSTPLSTPRPSVGESATASPLLISKPEDRGNLSAMPCSWALAFVNLSKDVPSPSSSFSPPGHEVGAIDNSPSHSPSHDKENDTDSSSSTHSSSPSHNSESFFTCNSNTVTSEEIETQAGNFQINSPLEGHPFGSKGLLRSDPVEQWSNNFMDLSLPWPPLSPLSSPTKSYTRLMPSQRIQEPQVCVASSLDSQTHVLDEITAYEHDILLVDVDQDDPDLFDNLPKQSMLKLGPLKSAGPPRIPPGGFMSRAGRALLEAKKRVTPATVQFNMRSVLTEPIEEESDSRPWRAERFTSSPTLSNSWPTITPVVEQNKLDTNNNNQTWDTSDGHLTIQANKPPFNSVGTKDCDNGEQRAGQRLEIREDLGVLLRHQSTTYCKFFFSENLSCLYKFCRFPHSPVEGDEKFCIETVLRFSKYPLCLPKASAVFTDYYQKNSPGVFFSNHVVTCLLWALLKAGLFMDILSVLNIIVTHKITPVPEFMLELFNVVREKDLAAILPELTRLTSQMALPPSMDSAQRSPDFHGKTLLARPGMFQHPLTTTTTTTSNCFPDSLNLAHTIVEVELCTKQKNWQRLGTVFKQLCQSSLPPLDLEQLSGRVAAALLTETSSKLPIPYVAFMNTVSQESVDDLMKTTLGRIGVSLMLRYYKTNQWGKGRQVVEILSSIQVAFSTLKGLFGNESAASRCSLITMASKHFLMSGSINGALNTLRDNEWFLASCSWPCAPDDLEKRTHLLLRLAEKTSHRDTLEILANLPGLKEPHESVDISQYRAVFNAHLQACVEKQMLPVASDLVELMMCKQLEAEAGMLKTLLNKLGKQNFWLRAREIFRRALKAGYYPEVAAPRDLQSLCIPPTLGEIEMALCLEMFISTNPSLEPNLAGPAASLCIILQRSHSCETVYLSASNRLISAAGVLQPRLTVHYTAVNPSQEQVFTLDMPSVHLWLQHNRLWANEVWSRLS